MNHISSPYGEFNRGYDDGRSIPETESVSADGRYLDLIRIRKPEKIGQAAGMAIMLLGRGDTEDGARILAEIYQTPFMPNTKVFEDYRKTGGCADIERVHDEAVRALIEKNRRTDYGFVEGLKTPALPSDYEIMIRDPDYARKMDPEQLGWSLGSALAVIGRTKETVTDGRFSDEAFNNAVRLAYTPFIDERLPFANEYYQGLKLKTGSVAGALERNGHFPGVIENIASAVSSLERARNPENLRGYPFPLGQ
jgi:hypothetical protein